MNTENEEKPAVAPSVLSDGLGLFTKATASLL